MFLILFCRKAKICYCLCQTCQLEKKWSMPTINKLNSSIIFSIDRLLRRIPQLEFECRTFKLVKLKTDVYQF